MFLSESQEEFEQFGELYKIQNGKLDSFVNSVYLYNDRIGLVYNYNDLTDSISLNDLQANTAQEGSDTDERGAPQTKRHLLRVSFSLLHFRRFEIHPAHAFVPDHFVYFFTG